MKVPLCYVVLSRDEPVEIAGQKDAFSLATRLRFYYEGLCFTVVELFFKLLHVARYVPSLGEELEFLREILLHGLEVLGQEVLAS
jgi:hypothetical protein